MTTLAIAPEPAPWIDAVAGDADIVFAPWASSRPTPPWLPRRMREFFDRRVRDNARGIVGWPLVEGASRYWAGSRPERKLRVRFAIRAAVDRLAAVMIARVRPDVVIAPSTGARASFAAAHRVGAECILVEDLPDIRELHDDLDRAARAHPSCGFLNRYRAPAALLARQEAERVLADAILVRGRFARDLRVERGADAARITELASPPPPPLPRWGGAPTRVLLAGLAAARHGTVEAVEAIAHIDGAVLVVRPGEGMEPADLLERPNVISDDGQGADVVIAPAWCESYPSEVARAAAAGIPVIATARAAGFASVTEVPVGDVRALSRALANVI